MCPTVHICFIPSHPTSRTPPVLPLTRKLGCTGAAVPARSSRSLSSVVSCCAASCCAAAAASGFRSASARCSSCRQDGWPHPMHTT
jgi:hypothetical protein